jgi:hypothetical protein
LGLRQPAGSAFEPAGSVFEPPDLDEVLTLFRSSAGCLTRCRGKHDESSLAPWVGCACVGARPNQWSDPVVALSDSRAVSEVDGEGGPAAHE